MAAGGAKGAAVVAAEAVAVAVVVDRGAGWVGAVDAAPVPVVSASATTAGRQSRISRGCPASR